MKQYDVLCVGISCVDIVEGTITREVLERNSTYIDTLSMHPGGDAVNQAIALSRLGCRTGLMTLVGGDPWGDFLLRELEKERIDITAVAREERVATTVSVVMLDENNERHFAVKKGSTKWFGPEHVDRRILERASIVSMGSSLSLNRFDGSPTCELFEQAKRHGAITVSDYHIGRRDRSEYLDILPDMLRLTDYCIPSYEEASQITGETETGGIVERLREMGAGNLIIKMGEKGCYVSADGISEYVPAFPAVTVDTTGAGDTFVAGFLYGMIREKGVLECARYGCAAGSIAVEAVGANTGLQSERQLWDRIERGRR